MAKAARNIHWVPQAEKDANGDCNSIGERNGNIYRITRAADGTFTATLPPTA